VGYSILLGIRAATGQRSTHSPQETQTDSLKGLSHVDGINPHDFAAGSNAYAAVNALVGIKIEEGIARINRKIFGHTVETIEPMLVKADAVDQVLEAACPALPAQETVEVMVAQNKFKGHTANLLNFCIIGNYHHPCLNGCATGWMKLFLFFNLNQAYTTGALRCESGTVAQRGYINSRTPGCVQDGHAFPSCYLNAVYG
jgi:hypothetical protein